MSVLEKLRMTSHSHTNYADDFPMDSSSDLDAEYDEGFTGDERHRDPMPGEAPPAPPKRARRAAKTPSSEPVRITKKHRDEAQEEVESFLQLIALTWGWQAPPCGDALEAAAPDIAAKLTKLLARNPKWLMRVRDGGMLADAVGIAVALKPVVQVAWAHYSQPRGGDDGGVVFDPANFPPYGGNGS